jgi:hypothetical protein
MECFAYVVFGGVVNHIQIDSLHEHMWSLDHFALMKVVAERKAL